VRGTSVVHGQAGERETDHHGSVPCHPFLAAGFHSLLSSEQAGGESSHTSPRYEERQAEAEAQAGYHHEKAEKAFPAGRTLYDPPEIGKLEKETLRTPPRRTVRERAGVGKLLVPTGGTSSFDAYIAGIIKSNWVRPSRAVVGENPRPVSVAIKIAMDGTITSWRITRGSGNGSLDDSAIKAIERSKRLPIGLPRDMGRRYYDVTIVFRLTDEA